MSATSCIDALHHSPYSPEVPQHCHDATPLAPGMKDVNIQHQLPLFLIMIFSHILNHLTLRILISLPSRFWLLARFFLVMALIATTLLGACKKSCQDGSRKDKNKVEKWSSRRQEKSRCPRMWEWQVTERL